MGLQVTPCANIPSPKRAASTDHARQLTCNGSAASAPSFDHHSKHHKSEEPNSKLETKISQLPAAPCANTHFTSDFYTSNFSLRSNSAKIFLSQCSSLASLPSLGLSSNGVGCSAIESGGSDGHAELLAACVEGAISAHCSCTSTLSSLGDQVVCDASTDDFIFYSASSGWATHSLKALSARAAGGATFSISAEFASKREGAVRALVVVGNQVFSSHSNHKIRVWARPDQSVKAEKMSCGGGITDGGEHRQVAALPTKWDYMMRAVTPGGYRQVRRHHRKLWIEHADAVSAMAVDATQGYLYSGSWDRTVKVWRLRDFKCIESFRAHHDAINTLALSPDGSFLYTAAADGIIKVWTWGDRSEGGQCRRQLTHCLVATLQAHRSAVNALALSADGALLYSGACDKAIVVWEREESQKHVSSVGGALRGHRQAVLCLASWGNSLCSGSADKSIRVWQRMAGRFHVCLAVLQGHSAPIKSISLALSHQQRPPSSPASGGTTLALCSAALDYDVKVWQIKLSITSP
ncbi:hypothetical protein L7F22_062483 [Adiantum nelumboides]|nr:hypothetical protein [Adiantum nelumboides]